MDIADGEREHHEGELAEISEKDLLLEAVVELKSIRWYISQGLDDQPQTDDAAEYQCKHCLGSVAADEREQHLVQNHNAPPGVPADGEYLAL